MTATLATFDRTLRDLVDDGQPILPDCPYCDKQISGETRSYGGGLMHRQCYVAFGEDMETSFPDEIAPIHPQLFDDAFGLDWSGQDDRTMLMELEEAQARSGFEVDDSPF